MRRWPRSGKDVWLDTETIADAEVFPEAIRRAIEECETFLFVITPASVESAYCGQEVDYAGELGKRIVPVLRERVPDDVLPVPIRDRNWIPFVDETEFERSVERVVTAVDTDLEYRQRHTRWLVKAVEWERAQEDKSLLLRGSELSAAESWLAGAKADADPPPTELQRSYLLRSRQANLRRQRRFAGDGAHGRRRGGRAPHLRPDLERASRVRRVDGQVTRAGRPERKSPGHRSRDVSPAVHEGPQRVADTGSHVRRP